MPQTSPSAASIDLEHLAKLARIALSDAEKIRFGKELDTILSYFKQLDEVVVEGVEPSAHAFPVYNVLRDDTSGPTLDTAVLQRIAPAFRDEQVAVPRVVDDEG
ncbi:MAG: Asp-tRNA(Asn)/Glu-tRNA(Gln) amidotransferase subunit GatC [Puniceicoccales bacterium]|jgi:aspartyl-tRNA(Asn)/glutamyl-tRNA(Gln) amidotransferase subunit C|nr:Asp-tRNA(Asn)/Glu-tRNA(Gln) amidotransferase subunit GatC [Puniceicoccales bacterium]